MEVIMAEATQQTYFTETPLERVHRIRDAIAEGGDEAQKVRRLPGETADMLIQEGLYRFTLPHELGGENASIRETIEVLETIAAIDGSVGWNVMIGSEINAIAAGGMDPAIAHYRMGEGEATLRAARAFLMETMDDVAEELEAGAPTPGPETTKLARLACTHAANVSMHVVDSVHNAAGTTSLRMDCPLERKFRDAHGCATHRWVAHPLYAELGKMFLGHPGLPELSGEGDAQPG